MAGNVDELDDDDLLESSWEKDNDEMKQLYRFDYKLSDNCDGNSSQIQNDFNDIAFALQTLRRYGYIRIDQHNKGYGRRSKSISEELADETLIRTSKPMRFLVRQPIIYITHSLNILAASHLIDSNFTGKFVVPSDDIKDLIAGGVKVNFDFDRFDVVPDDFEEYYSDDEGSEGGDLGDNGGAGGNLDDGDLGDDGGAGGDLDAVADGGDLDDDAADVGDLDGDGGAGGGLGDADAGVGGAAAAS